MSRWLVRGIFRAGVLVAALALPLVAGASRNAVVPVGPDLADFGWETHTFDGIPPTSFTGTSDGVIAVKADHSASVLYRRLDDLDDGRFLAWDWQVVDGLPATDLTRADGDDRVLAVHIWFRPRDGDVGMMARLAAALGDVPPGRVLTYVWGGDRERGTMFENPHNPENGRMIVLRPSAAPTGEWMMERVDLVADYERAFGEPATLPAAIAVSGDADDLMEMSFGLIRGIRFIS